MTTRPAIVRLFQVAMLMMLCVVLAVGFAAMVAYANLPPLDTLTDYRPKAPLREIGRAHV